MHEVPLYGDSVEEQFEEDSLGYYEIGCCQTQPDEAYPSPVRRRLVLSIDKVHDAFGTHGTEGGVVGNLACPSFEKFVHFPVHKSPILCLAPTAGGVLSLTRSMFKVHTAGGMGLITVNAKEGEDNMTCAVAQEIGSSTVIVGSENGGLSVFDLQRSSRVLLQVSIGYQSVLNMRRIDHLVACGTGSGSISLRDPRSGLQAEAVIQSYTGPIMSLDAQGQFLACSGMNMYRGHYLFDTIVKVFDIRKTTQPVVNIPFAPGAVSLSFHPSSSGLLLSCSGSGLAMFCETSNLEDPAWFHVNCEGDTLTAATMMPSGEGIVFSDSGGVAHLWGGNQDPRVNINGVPIETAVGQRHLNNFPSMSEEDCFSRVHLMAYESLPLSSLDDKEEKTSIAGPRLVDESLYLNAKMSDFVHYAVNPNFRRGIAYQAVSRATAHLRNRRAQSHREKLIESKTLKKRDIPSIYHTVEIPQSFKRIRSEDFDVSYYNQTKFAGLENGLANCYANPLLQLLYFVTEFNDYTQLPNWVLNFGDEFSLTSELGYLFHMMDICPHDQPCQATNFLRALRHMKQAGLLGLLEAERGVPGSGSELETAKDKSLPWRMQSLCRFLIEQLAKEESGACGSSSVHNIFGMNVESTISLPTGLYPSVKKSSTSYVLDLRYPSRHASEGKAPLNFTEVLDQSLLISQDMRAWFEPAGEYMQVTQVKTIVSLSKYFFINCNIKSDSDMNFWASQSQNDNQPCGPWPAEKLCFSQDPERGNHMRLVKEESQACLEVSSQCERFELMGIITFVADEVPDSIEKIKDATGHLVAHIRTGSMKETSSPSQTAAFKQTLQDVTKQASFSLGQQSSAALVDMAGVLEENQASESDWVLFNDFCINPTSCEEPRKLYGLEKIPCILLYRKESERPEKGSLIHGQRKNLPTVPLDRYCETFTCIVDAPPLNAGLAQKPYTFKKLDLMLETPGPQMLLGIDAEFVALSAEEKSTAPDGSEEVIRPPRLGLARISVVRGNGPQKFVPCIDDHIQTLEPVHDYLTQYSGIKAGDLHANKSTHYLTTLRCAYIKLRFLIDSGCTFIGHGLKKDMRMINIVIPPENIVDTVDLFHLKPQRRLSLKFLAAYFLGQDVQVGVHDSIEDACTAIKLYEIYKVLERSNRVHKVLINLYSFGRARNWDVDAALQEYQTLGEQHHDAL